MSAKDGWASPGALLRWWRHDVAGISQRDLARRLAVGHTTVSNWEIDARTISTELHPALDSALRAEGALAGLLWAFGSRTGLEPRHVWSNTYDGPSSPVWGWIRSPARQVKLEGEWGLFGMAVELDLGPNGAFITVGASVSASAVVGQLSEPGWIDFGRGPLPPMPGATVVDGLDVVVPSSSEGVFEERFSADAADWFANSRPREAARASRRTPRTLAEIVRRFDRTVGEKYRVAGPWPPVPPGFGEVDRARFQRLREARSLSLAETVARLDAETGVTVSRDTLRRFESATGGASRRLLPVALDHVLGAGGQLAVVELKSNRGPGTARVPPFWKAPTWLAFDADGRAPGSRETVLLRWGDWGKELQLELPALVVMHYAESSQVLRIHTAPDVRWTVGLGRRSGAQHIDQGWAPADLEVLQRAVADTERALFEALERRVDPAD